MIRFRYLKYPTIAGCQWLIPIILATQEAEFRRIMVQSQPWANCSLDSILKKPIKKKKGWWSGSSMSP
jgi:hypothetical protein